MCTMPAKAINDAPHCKVLTLVLCRAPLRAGFGVVSLPARSLKSSCHTFEPAAAGGYSTDGMVGLLHDSLDVLEYRNTIRYVFLRVDAALSDVGRCKNRQGPLSA